MAPIMAVMFIGTTYMIIVSKNLLKKYLLVGSLIFGSIISLFIYNFNFFIAYKCFAHPIVFGSLLLENIIFSLALGKKQRLIFEEKLVFEKKLNEEKLNLLRSHLNPHFFFNVLNSIKSLLIENNVKSAIKSLGVFSKMMRDFFNSSQETEHSLKNELRILTNYINTENIRFDEPINFKILNNLEFNEDLILLPSLVLQPFAENVIKHGFTFTTLNKKIRLNLLNDVDFLQYKSSIMEGV